MQPPKQIHIRVEAADVLQFGLKLANESTAKNIAEGVLEFHTSQRVAKSLEIFCSLRGIPPEGAQMIHAMASQAFFPRLQERFIDAKLDALKATTLDATKY